MQKTFIAIAALVGLLVVLASTATAAGTKGGRGIVKSGKCSAHSTWKLKAKNDDGRIETEFEVDQNRVGKRWRVTIFRNGSKVFSGIRTTRARAARSRSAACSPRSAGTDRIVAKARALEQRRELQRCPLHLTPSLTASRPEASLPPVSAFLREVLPWPRARPACGR